MLRAFLVMTGFFTVRVWRGAIRAIRESPLRFALKGRTAVRPYEKPTFPIELQPGRTRLNLKYQILKIKFQICGINFLVELQLFSLQPSYPADPVHPCKTLHFQDIADHLACLGF